jgi:hypothetical protein
MTKAELMQSLQDAVARMAEKDAQIADCMAGWNVALLLNQVYEARIVELKAANATLTRQLAACEERGTYPDLESWFASLSPKVSDDVLPKEAGHGLFHKDGG